MNRIRRLYKFILHFLTARHTHGFGVHSPYVYRFTDLVVYNTSVYYIFSSIEKIRLSLKRDTTELEIVDFGTGGNRTKSIAEITRTSLKPARYGQLLYRLTEYIKAGNILELGTSLGLTSSYLAAPSSAARMVSLEGSEKLAEIAKANFKLLGITNIEIVTGNIDLTLTGVVDDFSQLDLVFIDANHHSKAVLAYFEQILRKIRSESIVVVDDIYWSPDMEYAWKTIKQHPRVTSTIDLFELGIVFFNEDLHRKNYKMRF